MITVTWGWEESSYLGGMDHNPEFRRRKPLRLPGYDYRRAGYYFITVCTRNRERLFGKIQLGTMHPTQFGLAVEKTWNALTQYYPYVELDTFVLMPDHVHGIIVIPDAMHWVNSCGR